MSAHVGIFQATAYQEISTLCSEHDNFPNFLSIIVRWIYFLMSSMNIKRRFSHDCCIVHLSCISCGSLYRISYQLL